jgi:hypothetical protein
VDGRKGAVSGILEFSRIFFVGKTKIVYKYWKLVIHELTGNNIKD